MPAYTTQISTLDWAESDRRVFASHIQVTVGDAEEEGGGGAGLCRGAAAAGNGGALLEPAGAAVLGQ